MEKDPDDEEGDDEDEELDAAPEPVWRDNREPHFQIAGWTANNSLVIQDFPDSLKVYTRRDGTWVLITSTNLRLPFTARTLLQLQNVSTLRLGRITNPWDNIGIFRMAPWYFLLAAPSSLAC